MNCKEEGSREPSYTCAHDQDWNRVCRWYVHDDAEENLVLALFVGFNEELLSSLFGWRTACKAEAIAHSSKA
jgi:hypothetical protein